MNSIVQILVPVLNSLWQAAIVAALVWLALKLARRRNLAMNAATRYVVWWAALGVVLVLPAAPGALALWRTRTAHTSTSTAAPKAAQPVLPAANFDAPALITLREQRSTRWPFWVLGIWSAAFLYRLIEIARSYFYLRGVKRRAVISSQPLPEKKRSARLLLSSEVVSPMAVGFLRPAVILPETLPAEITGEEMHHVLLHEYAHLARLDDWSNLIAHVLGAVLALHPPAWWILRQIGREREMACDDWVVARTGSARPYAASLARLSELRWSRRQQAQGEALASGMFGGGSRLGERIELLLKSGAGNPARSRLLGGLFAGLLIALTIVLSPAPRWIAFAQRVEFEVTSVKLPGPQDRIIALYNYPGGRVVISLYTFAMLLHEALGVQRFQVVGAAPWIDSERFMIEAQPPASSKLSSFTPSNREAPLVEEQRQMLLALLMERFQLKFHRESKEGVVYLLSKGPKEPKFETPKHPEYRMFFAGLLGGGNGTVSGGNATMELIVSQLSRSMGGPVLDRTGLTGPFDFTLEHVYDPEEEHDLVTIAQRTVGALGLKLERSRGPVEMLVIDHAEKPDAN